MVLVSRLATGRHIAAAEIGNDPAAGQFGQATGVVELIGKGGIRVRGVLDGLAVAADGRDGIGCQAVALQQLEHGKDGWRDRGARSHGEPPARPEDFR